MVSNTFFTAAIVLAVASRVSAHVSLWHPSMFGFNESTAPNRAQDPLMNLPFNEWWMHGLLDKPPHPEDIMQLPVGRSVTTELSCDKDSTSYWTSGPGGDQRNFKNPNSPCPGAKSSAAYHTNGINDLGGCALGVAYESDPYKIKPEDFTIFSVNQTCVWYRFTDFQIPKMMPKCPNEKCICAWFWIHRADSGSEQMFFTPFQCNMQDATSTTPLPPAQVARRCGLDPDFNRPANASNCTYGAKQPLYWYQLEGNNQFEDTYHPPLYNDLFHFLDGAQDDIFDPAYYNMSNLTSSSAMPTASPPPSRIGSGTNPSDSSSPIPTQGSSPVMLAKMAQHTEPPPSPAESTHEYKPKHTSSPSGKKVASPNGHKSAPPPHHQHHDSHNDHHHKDNHHYQGNHHYKDNIHHQNDPCDASVHELGAMPASTPHPRHEPRTGEEPVHRDLGRRHRHILRRKRNF